MMRATGFGRIGIGVPYYRACYEFWRWWSWVLIAGLEPGDALLNDDTIPGEVPIPVAHNALVRAFLATDLDTLCIVEDDHCDADNQTIRRLRMNPDNWQYDVVCASYTNRRGVPRPMGWSFVDWDPEHRSPVKRAGGYWVSFDNEAVELEGTQEVDGAALGCVLVRRWVLEAMRDRSPDPEHYYWFRWEDAQSQDVNWYAEVKACGGRVGVDRSVWIQHVGKYVYSRSDFVNWREQGRRQLREEAERGR